MSNTEPPFDPSLNPYIGADRQKLGGLADFLNKIASKLDLPFQLSPRFDYRNQMVSVEQVVNFQHLIERIESDKIPGAFVEMGCYIGCTAAVISSTLQRLGAKREFHVFDRFDIELGDAQDIETVFRKTFAACELPLPAMHTGDFKETVPAQLPDQIAFAHVDCGTGGDVADHAALLIHCLNSLYPRMCKGGVIVLMDYHVPGTTVDGFNANPGVRLGTDVFLGEKPEQIKLLYGGPCSHAYIRMA